MIGIVDYNMGNVQSVINAFDYISAKTKVIRSINDFAGVDKIVLPGVGAFGEGMNNLSKLGYIEVLNVEVLEKKKLFLGICLGMQLICKESFEFGHFKGLSWIDVSVRKFNLPKEIRIPHIGWNNLIIKKNNKLIKSDSKNSLDVYFVHSYFVDALASEFTVASCEYGIEFASIIEKDNIFATQFHPEKSQSVGLEILKNFSNL